MDNNIKNFRNDELVSYVIAHLIIISVSSGVFNFILDSENASYITIIISLLSSVVFSSVIYIYVLLFDSILPNSIKDIIIWVFTGLPGDHIFTSIKNNNKDKRFNTKQALSIYKGIYESIEIAATNKDRKIIENNSWYKIYKKHENDASVKFSQRDYLLCRDLFFTTLFIVVGYIVFQLYLDDSISWQLIVWFIVELILTWLSARYKGVRFAYNVIACDISENDKSDILQL